MRALYWAALTVFSVGLCLQAERAAAQDVTQAAIPTLPPPLQNLVSEGAQARFLGKDYGLDAWMTIKNGQEQYFYIMPDQDAFLMGVMFDNDGKLVTVDQVRRLQEQGDTFLDSLADDNFAGLTRNRNDAETDFAFKTPAEQLYFDIEQSNWVPLGQAGAPIAYAFIDPQCPHCHTLINNLRADYIEPGRMQLRMIPVGFKDETRAQAAYLMAAPNPQTRLYAHMNGDPEALPARQDINQQGVQRNLAVMQSWDFDVTPMIIYRAKDGQVKIIRGNAKDIPALVDDLGARS